MTTKRKKGKESSITFLESTITNQQNIKIKISLHPAHISIRNVKSSKLKSNSKKLNFSLVLTWVYKEQRKDDMSEVWLSFKFPGVGYHFNFGTIELRDQWYDMMYDAIQACTDDQFRGLRQGEFCFPNGATYEGSWLEARPHGEGILVMDSGSSYTGKWNSELGCGIGKKRRNGKSMSGSWNFDVITGEIHFHSKVINASFIESGFFQDDIELMIQHGEKKMFEKGEFILKEGVNSTTFYWIIDGTVQVLQRNRVVATMGKDSFFGELSLLDNTARTSATLQASSRVVTSTFTLPTLLQLFHFNNDLSVRFFRAMVLSVSERLRSVHLKQLSQQENDKMTWGKLRSVLTFSGLLAKAGIQTEESYSDEFEECVSLLNDNRFEALSNFFAPDLVFLDPFAPSGISDANLVMDHLKNFYTKIQFEILEKIYSDLIITLRMKLKHKNCTQRFAMIMQYGPDNLFSRWELYFDKEQLNSNQEQSHDNIDIIDKNNAILKKFGLEHQLIEYESTCSISIEKIITEQLGTLYITRQNLCFASTVLDFELKKVIPLREIKNVVLPEDDRVLSLVFKTGYSHGGANKLSFTFESKSEASPVFILLRSLVNPIPSVIEISDDFIMLYNEEHKLHEKIPTITIHPPVENSIRIQGPTSDSSLVTADGVAANSISCYPFTTDFKDGNVVVNRDHRQGDPICDQFCLEKSSNLTIFALADGCNWGVKPRNAAFAASRRFIDYVKNNQLNINDARQASHLFIKAFSEAQKKIMQTHETWWEIGTTTMVAGSIFEVNATEKEWMTVLVGVGDCKAYHIHNMDGLMVNEITVGSRSGENINDASDCGGRLGPQIEGNPDLRNFNAWYTLMTEGDYMILCSDGVHDNLDPQNLGISPIELGLGDKDWDNNDPDQVEEVKNQYSTNLLKEIIEPIFQDGSPKDDLTDSMCNALLEYAKQTTSSSRDFMETYPDKPMPHDYLTYPGKMDHTTCIAIKATKGEMTSYIDKLKNMTMRLQHPISGIEQQVLYSKDDTKQLTFYGNALISWITSKTTHSEDFAVMIAQNLLNFQFIKEIKHNSSEFDKKHQYQFKIFDAVLKLEDWSIILKMSKTEIYSAGDSIISDASDKLYQIVKGTCQITYDGGETIQLGESDFFNEHSFFKEPIGLAAVAQTDVELYVFEMESLELLKTFDLNIVSRFYNYIVRSLSHTFTRIEQEYNDTA